MSWKDWFIQTDECMAQNGPPGSCVGDNGPIIILAYLGIGITLYIIYGYLGRDAGE